MQRLSAEEAAFDHSLHLVSHLAAALRPSAASHSKGDFQKLPDDVLAGYPVERFEFAAGLIQESTQLRAPHWVESRKHAEASWGSLYTRLARNIHAKQVKQVAKVRQRIVDLARLRSGRCNSCARASPGHCGSEPRVLAEAVACLP